MKKLNMKTFEAMNPCKEGYQFVLDLKTTDLAMIFKALNEHDLDWSNWLVVRLLSRKDLIRYAIFSAEQVIDIFEAKHPNDTRPREAIEAAKKVMEHDTIKNREAAHMAANSANAAARKSASDAVCFAAYAAYYAAYAADSAHAAYAAYAAYHYADYAAYAANKKMKLKIVEYGLSLLGVTKKEWLNDER